MKYKSLIILYLETLLYFGLVKGDMHLHQRSSHVSVYSNKKESHYSSSYIKKNINYTDDTHEVFTIVLSNSDEDQSSDTNDEDDNNTDVSSTIVSNPAVVKQSSEDEDEDECEECKSVATACVSTPVAAVSNLCDQMSMEAEEEDEDQDGNNSEIESELSSSSEPLSNEKSTQYAPVYIQTYSENVEGPQDSSFTAPIFVAQSAVISATSSESIPVSMQVQAPVPAPMSALASASEVATESSVNGVTNGGNIMNTLNQANVSLVSTKNSTANDSSPALANSMMIKAPLSNNTNNLTSLGNSTQTPNLVTSTINLPVNTTSPQKNSTTNPYENESATQNQVGSGIIPSQQSQATIKQDCQVIRSCSWITRPGMGQVYVCTNQLVCV